jgi:hypothetical protein
MSDRLAQLEMRRRALLLRSERLRADLAADQRVMLKALSGVDRFYANAKRVAPTVLMAGGGLLLLGLLRGSRRRGPARSSGFLTKTLFWVTTARRVLPYVPLIKALCRSRFSQRPHPPPQPDDYPHTAP